MTNISNFPYKINFDGLIVRAKVASDYDKYLATASLKNLAPLLPKVDLEKNLDILGISFDAFVACKANKNGQIIDGPHALQVASLFINKYINVEHLRKNVIGFITNYGFSEFGSSIILSKENVEELSSKNIPFNITLSGIIWRFIDENIAKEIEESSDPSSLKYMSVSASWELAFKEFNIARGSKNIADAEIISDKDTIVKLKNRLSVFGGNGYDEDGLPIYTNIIGDSLLGLGVGITNSPAAEVKGILVAEEKKLNNEINSSVIVDTTKNIIPMAIEIKSLSDINDESLKMIAASEITKFIENSLLNASKEWASKLEEKETNILELNKTVASLTEKITELSNKIATREFEDKFQARMSSIDDKYELDPEFSKIIAEEIKLIDSEEDFEKWFKKFSVLAKDRNKDNIVARKEEERIRIAQASISSNKDSIIEVISNATVESSAIPNIGETNTISIAERMKAAFLPSNIIKIKK